MIKDNIAYVLIAVLVVTLGYLLWTFELDESSDNKSVVATIYPIYDITRNIAPEGIEVDYIVEPGTDPHNFEPSPSDIEKLEQADEIFIISEEYDEWLNLNDFNNTNAVSDEISLIEGEAHDDHDEENEEDHSDEEEEEEEHESYDPHYWLSPINAIQISENVGATLVTQYPEQEDEIKENLNNYISELESLDQEIRTKLIEYNGENFITFHNAFQYFADEYGLEVAATIEPYPGQEPTAKYLEEVEEVIAEYEIKVLYREPQMSETSLQVIAESNDIEILVLDPLGGNEDTADTYIELIKFNTDQLIEGFDSE